MQEVAELEARIEQLEERMRGADALIVLWETRATRAEARVEQLEAALREIEDKTGIAAAIARAALAPEQKK
jgi:BMFP domain-containing protein YqiC